MKINQNSHSKSNYITCGLTGGNPQGSLAEADGCDGLEMLVAPNEISNRSIRWLSCLGLSPFFLKIKKKKRFTNNRK
jgi:hypothetical protein